MVKPGEQERVSDSRASRAAGPVKYLPAARPMTRSAAMIRLSGTLMEIPADTVFATALHLRAQANRTEDRYERELFGLLHEILDAAYQERA